MTDQVNTDNGALSKMVMRLMDLWQLTGYQQAALLGLAANDRRTLARYRKGIPIGSNRDQLERVGHLLAIHQNLRLLFPQNRALVYRWMTTRNKAFENLRPVEAIQELGFAGMLMVRTYLDRAVGETEFTTSGNDGAGKEQTPRTSGRQVYSTKDLPDELREAIGASVAPPWTIAFNHEVES